MLEGLHHEVPIRDLCRGEGIRPSMYYACLKDFMEAGKEHLQRDSVRDEKTRCFVDFCSSFRVKPTTNFQKVPKSRKLPSN